ncbi:endonuclease V [Microbulbifer taiwanensis]|uniref:Endonuclease V n=1 Tax=Microbulbifer taiwanensis TaxID=986746 RepID=A0ABW1YH42_9GAMM|nr:endonuclease V [Microbulbifer taiwanensis]
MILAIDVDYRESDALAAGISFNDWQDEIHSHIYRGVISEIEDYESGSFYRRELPCILHLLKEHHLSPEIIVIDGFVHLGDESRPGLGMHLYNALDRKVPVIGVTKSPFKKTAADTKLLRGDSARPLYITAAGMELETAKACILSIHGKHRIPTLLKQADRECRRK